MNYAIVGYGRMGRAVQRQADGRGHRRVAVIDPAESVPQAKDRIEPASLREADLAFEFTVPAAAEANVIALLSAGVSVVCGTTGWRPSPSVERAALESNAGAVIAPNFSVGMNLFYRLVAEAGRWVGTLGLHQPFVLESHHRGKRDVPSGTARRLAAILVETVPGLSQVVEGNPEQPLPDNALHVASVRAGSEPGCHTVGFDGEHDKIVLTHAARSRDGFALGAVLAAEWIRGKTGLHDFDETLKDLLERG